MALGIPCRMAFRNSHFPTGGACRSKQATDWKREPPHPSLLPPCGGGSRWGEKDISMPDGHWRCVVTHQEPAPRSRIGPGNRHSRVGGNPGTEPPGDGMVGSPPSPALKPGGNGGSVGPPKPFHGSSEEKTECPPASGLHLFPAPRITCFQAFAIHCARQQPAQLGIVADSGFVPDS